MFCEERVNRFNVIAICKKPGRVTIRNLIAIFDKYSLCLHEYINFHHNAF